MGHRRADLFFADAPYSARTHDGYGSSRFTKVTTFAESEASATDSKKALSRYAERISNGSAKKCENLQYAAWSQSEVSLLCACFTAYVHGWWASITDHELGPCWENAFKVHKLLTFAPLPWVETGSRVRLMGDGPSNWTCWLIVGRPRNKEFARWGTLPGAYILPAENHQNRPDRITGGKSLPGMMALLGDYSREGQLVVDPCLGGGTTAIAAIRTGRRCIGIEQDRGRAELCAELVRAELNGTTRSASLRGQTAMFGGV
ncbi:MAG: hypothetical protein IPP12_22325 [Nitrospira sp.]|nr:hypothetical protein [Nitrospira sp.]